MLDAICARLFAVPGLACDAEWRELQRTEPVNLASNSSPK